MQTGNSWPSLTSEGRQTLRPSGKMCGFQSDVRSDLCDLGRNGTRDCYPCVGYAIASKGKNVAHGDGVLQDDEWFNREKATCPRSYTDLAVQTGVNGTLGSTRLFTERTSMMSDGPSSGNFWTSSPNALAASCGCSPLSKMA